MWRGEGEKEVGIIGCREQGALIQMTIQLIISYFFLYLQVCIESTSSIPKCRLPRELHVCHHMTLMRDTNNAPVIFTWV